MFLSTKTMFVALFIKLFMNLLINLSIDKSKFVYKVVIFFFGFAFPKKVKIEN